MKHSILILIVLASFSFSCKTTKDVKSTTDEIIFTLDKKSGRGIGPVYSLKIYESGKVIYFGQKNAEKIGTFTNQLEKKTINSLKEEFIQSDFFSFDDEYTSNVRDLPTTYISFQNEGKTKRIRDYYGAPEKLKNLEKLLEEIANISGWTKEE